MLVTKYEKAFRCSCFHSSAQRDWEKGKYEWGHLTPEIVHEDFGPTHTVMTRIPVRDGKCPKCGDSLAIFNDVPHAATTREEQ